MKNASCLTSIFIRNSQKIIKEIRIKVLTTYLLQKRIIDTRLPNEYNLFNEEIKAFPFNLTNTFKVPRNTVKSSGGTKVNKTIYCYLSKYYKTKCILDIFLANIQNYYKYFKESTYEKR